MTTARTSPEYHTSAAGHPDEATRHHHGASTRLFEKDHAYAARLVQIATSSRSVVRSTKTMKLPDRVPSEIERDDRTTSAIVTQPRAHGSGS